MHVLKAIIATDNFSYRYGEIPQYSTVGGASIYNVILLTISFLLRKLVTVESNLSFGTPLFRRHKLWTRRNVHIIFLSVTSIEGTPVFRERDTFSGPRSSVLTFRGHLTRSVCD